MQKPGSRKVTKHKNQKQNNYLVDIYRDTIDYYVCKQY